MAILSSQSRTRRLGRKAVSLEILSGVLIAIDFLVVLVVGRVAFWAWITTYDIREFQLDWLSAVLGAFLFVVGLRSLGGYAPGRLSQFRWQIGRIGVAWGGTVSVLAFIAFLTKISTTYSRGWALVWLIMAYLTLCVSRAALSLLLHHWARTGRLARCIAIVGTPDAARDVIAKLALSIVGKVIVTGVFDEDLKRIGGYAFPEDLDDGPHDLMEVAREMAIDEVIIALPLSETERISDAVEKLRSLPVDLRLSIEALARNFPIRGVAETASVRVIEVFDRPLKHWSGLAKSIEDFIIGAVCLLIFAPLMALIALAISLDSRGPVFFVQDRFGFNNRTVRVLKFRTMHVESSDPSGAQRTVPNDPRVTRVGYVLRTLSLDELPQLFNVLRGDMSLVGPRPHAIAMRAGDQLYHDAVTEYFHRHRVRPGMTGWAQVHGLRGEIDTVEKARHRVAYDLYYIDHWSLWLDLKILVMTVRVLLFRQNAY